MIYTDTIISLLRCYHYTVELPVRFYSGRSVLCSLPEQIVSSCEITSNMHLAPVPDDDKGLQYLSNDAGENFIYIKLSQGEEIMVGPFLLENVNPLKISELVLNGTVNARSKQSLIEHLNSLSVVSSQKHFYAGALLETLIQNVVPGSSADAEIDTDETISSEYYLQNYIYRTEHFIHTPYATEQEICKAITNGEAASALYILRDINSRPRARLARTRLRSLKNSLIGSCTFMARAAIKGGVNPDVAFTLSDTFIQNIELTNSVNSLYDIEEDMVLKYTDAVNREKNKNYSLTVKSAINYIDTHLCDNISVESVARSIFLSPNYLSSLFLRETGETVHSYIIRKRVEESAFYVKNTRDSFADIAVFYQFCSQSHFVQCFKKYKGVTPGVYRKSNTEEKN